jgi:hypothetical protein
LEQKIAEFNSDRPLYANLKSKKLIEKVSELRNARIQFTENIHGLENSIKLPNQKTYWINIQLFLKNLDILFFDHWFDY